MALQARPALPRDPSIYLAAVAEHAGLRGAEILGLAERISAAITSERLQAIRLAVAARLSASVGPVLPSVAATLPSEVADDFGAARVMCIEGVIFSHTELALLTALARAGASDAVA